MQWNTDTDWQQLSSAGLDGKSKGDDTKWLHNHMPAGTCEFKGKSLLTGGAGNGNVADR